MSENKNILPFLLTTPEQVVCKGLFWRGSESMYLSAHKSVEQRRSLRFLKKNRALGVFNVKGYGN